MPSPRTVSVGKLAIANDRPFTLIAGPCALESRAHAQEMCHALVEMTGQLGIGLIYKTSFDKANRTSSKSAGAPATPRAATNDAVDPISRSTRQSWRRPA